ncbi:hypothetical protein ACFQ1M_08420 [Sungkyunkwania multivorans]|uniref:Tfp pilus assembly protein PilO n=1 Tax=Sungkyunkwania multivorans TaxID=1173618 RepID=A0ABW3CZD8_9FLAO
MSSRNKNIILVIGLLFLAFLGYRFAISKTVAARSTYKKLSRQAILFENLPKQFSVLKQKERYYDSLLAAYQIKGNSIQSNLLKTVNTYADEHRLKVIAFKEPHILERENATLSTYSFSLEGDFSSILRLIHQLERRTRYGELVNVHFEKKKNYRTRKFYLQAHILLQVVRQK